jgi:peroxiredoxin
MLRYWIVALLTLVPTSAGVAQNAVIKLDKDFKVPGKLTREDPKDTRRDARAKIYRVEFKAGRVYTIDLSSRQFDSYLRLEDSAGNQLDEDDDSGGNLDARIVFTCSKDGEYRVIATSLAEATGNYTLSIKSVVQTVKQMSSHAALVGKPAPEVTGDFAVNGKPVRLSDLKGKVVLLAFWEVASAPSLAVLPRLQEWNKTFKANGVEIVAVTYYHSDLGHKLAFDKERGTVKRVEAANRESDRALLRDFAAHHKLDFMVMALPREVALEAFNEYFVNPVPQFVLIDRDGNVRFIRAGGDEGTAKVVEGEIRKLVGDQ